MSPDYIERIKRSATPVNREAMRELEARGFQFLVHFGTANAAWKLAAMDNAFREGRLYEYLRLTLGEDRR